MGIKHCGRWALYGSSEVAGVSVSGRTSCRSVGGRSVGGRSVGGRSVGGRSVGGRSVGGRSVGGRRFSDGVLNSNGSELG